MDDQDDSNLSSVVARADALMQRRRQPAPEELPVLTEVVDPDADLPVLTLEDAIEVPQVEAEPPAPAELPPPDPAVLNIIAHELARRLGERLAAEIPVLVEAAVQSLLPELAKELRRGLADTTEEAIHDFLAERERLAKIQRRN
ncbi:MAG TPA: hypothetical protein VFF03_01695 [Rhodocyclaceae bacterium]|nr:hypothetical protein [Rhodocyclaceae bacterium]